MINYKTMYKLKNYLLSMQSHWMINQPTYKAVQDTLPLIAKYKASDGQQDLPKTPVHKVVKKIYPEIYKVPLFRRHFCNLLVKEIEMMKKEIDFVGNEEEDATNTRNCFERASARAVSQHVVCSANSFKSYVQCAVAKRLQGSDHYTNSQLQSCG